MADQMTETDEIRGFAIGGLTRRLNVVSVPLSTRR
jgi:hypothetical protein